MSKKLVTAALLFILSVAARSQVVAPPYEYGSYSIGRCYDYYKAGLLDEAEELLSKAIENFPETPAYDLAVLLQAKIDLANNNYNLAIQRLTIFITERSNSSLAPHAALERAYMAFEKGKYKYAEKYFLEAKKLADAEFLEREDSSYNLLAHYSVFWRAVSLAFDKRLEESGAVFNECVTYYRRGPFTDDALFALGLTEEMKGHYRIALTYYNTIEANHPFSNSIVASKIREMNNYIMLRDANSALLASEKAGRIIKSITDNDSTAQVYEPQSYFDTAPAELLYLKGEAYNIAANYTMATELFNDFIAKYSGSGLISLVRLSMGWALLNLQNYSESIKYFDIIISTIEDENSTVRSLAALYRSLALKKSGKADDALRELSALSVQPGYPYSGNVLLELGQMYYETGDFSNTARVLERGLRESNSELVSTKINLLLGAAYMEQQRWSKAVQCYQDAGMIALKSSYIAMPQRDWYIAEANLRMGISLANGGNFTQAVPPLLKFLVQYPNDKKADEAAFWLAES